MDSVARAWADRDLYTIIEEDEEIQHSSTEAFSSADDHLQQPSAVSWVESSDGEDNSLGSVSPQLGTVLAEIEHRPNPRLNRPYRESALLDGPRLLRNPSRGSATDGLTGIVDRNTILDSSGGVASEMGIRSYRQWCLERGGRQRAGSQSIDLVRRFGRA
ncbi:hypothetical protein [Bradyrhizobium yuanmingense]|uniref:hypothetical protein n=1 Tax=Bradyrhizobium yuanmingense TaxID=108015 RepID=UPI00114CC87E|nr:hypothetical protein [Bradyrhizobium yuanmingense]